MSLDLVYFHGNEAEQYSFYRIPKVLLTDRRYKGVSMEAKVLYGLMLDRMSLSVRNGWLDNEGRVYIYFTLEDTLAALGCGKDKAVRLFKELDTPNGIGLIERRKRSFCFSVNLTPSCTNWTMYPTSRRMYCNCLRIAE